MICIMLSCFARFLCIFLPNFLSIVAKSKKKYKNSQYGKEENLCYTIEHDFRGGYKSA